MKINVEKDWTKSQRRKLKKEEALMQKISLKRKNKNRNRKIRQRNKTKSRILKESRHRRDLKRVYGESVFPKKN